MSPLDTPAVLSAPIEPHVATAAADDSQLASAPSVAIHKAAWDGAIDRCLIEWGKDLDSLADEDLIPPSPDVLNLACAVATHLRDQGAPGPLRVVPDGDGGISFERRSGEWFESLRIYPDLSVELLAFRDCHLVGRRRL